MAPAIQTKDSKGHIIIIDDEPEVRTVVRLHLKSVGYNVVEAGNGEEAIQAVGSGDNPLLTDAILCDIRMPKINGIEAIAFFREQYPSIPVIVVTGYPDMEMAKSFLEQGIFDYLVKPVEKAQLLEVVDKAVASRTMLGRGGL